MRTCTHWGLKNCVQQLQNCVQNILGVNFRFSFELRRRRQKYEEITKESEHFEDNKNTYSVRSGVRKTAYTTENCVKYALFCVTANTGLMLRDNSPDTP